MRTHITTKYSDCKAFEESYPLMMAEYKKDEEAKLLIELRETDEVFAHAFVCEDCGHEYYVDWRDRHVSCYYSDHVKSQKPKYQSVWESGKSEIELRFKECNKKYKKYACIRQDNSSTIHKKYEAFCKSDKTRCPVCGKALKNTPQTVASTYAIGESLRCDHSDKAHQAVIDALFARIYFERNKINKELAIEKALALESSVQAFDFGTSLEETMNLSSPKELMGYVAKILTLETNLVSLKDWLKSLYQKEITAAKAVKECVLFAQKDSDIKLQEYRLNLEKLRAVDPTASVKRETIQRQEVTYPALPKEPTYEKPGLFNKKKVEAENEKKRQSFELAKLEYSQRLAQCTHQQKIYDDEYEVRSKQAEADYLYKCDEVRANHEAAIAECMDAIAEWEQKKAFYATPEFLENKPEKVLKDMLDTDIAQAEDLFKRTHQARSQLYSRNVIFAKYRNPVAMATFYEYLMSGRCTTLDGPTGAYNLYESEIRANMIISQLSEVIDNLEKIKENQFTIYSQLSSMNQGLQQLNSTMNSAVVELKGIKDNTSAISENTAVIAHNTAVTAYYAKKTAELTDALGYMVALT